MTGGTPRPVWAWLVVELTPAMRYEALGVYAEREAVVEGPRLKCTVMGMTGRTFEEADKKLRTWCRKWYPWLTIP